MFKVLGEFIMIKISLFDVFRQLVKDRLIRWGCDVIYNKKHVFGLHPHSWHRSPKTLGIS